MVTAVVPSWNTAAHLGRCLDSLDAQVGVSVQTIVVDNGSSDASLALLQRRGVPHIALAANIGFAAAVNLGAERTRGQFVLVLNADCSLAADCVRQLALVLAADSKLGGVQPRITQQRAAGEPARIYSAGQCLTRRGAAFERGWGELDGKCFAEGVEVFGVSGAACLLRRELFTELHGYDPEYFAFYEDVDLNARARLAGWGFAYVPDARVVHAGHAAWRQHPRAHAFNVELTVRNRLATAVKVLPRRGVLGSLVLTVRSLAASPFRGTAIAALRGTATVTRWLPRLISERRRVRAVSPHRLDDWLLGRPGEGPDPGGM